MLVVNLFGGPGCGKSTVATGVFSELKQRGINAEYVHEWVKWPVLEKRTAIFEDQLYIFSKQHKMIRTVDGQVDVAITDSPLLLSNIYSKIYKQSYMDDHPYFSGLVSSVFNSFQNMNVFLERRHDYVQVGRVQTEQEACELDDLILQELIKNNHKYHLIPSSKLGIKLIADQIERSIS